jgi:ATP-dependent RNA helicase RhlE
LSTFEGLGLAESLLRAVSDEGYHTATPIQLEAIPPLLAGRDLMGCAQTGTGKTAAFALPTMQRLGADKCVAPTENSTQSQGGARFPAPSRSGRRFNNRRDTRRPDFRRAADRPPIRALVLAPTRELAAQIQVSFETYGRFTGLRSTVIYGGVGQNPQVRAMQAGVDILVATPGRLLDLMEQGYVDLRKVEILILDEADQMLDMGFIIPLRRIVAAVPRVRQTLMFSATMPPEIKKLASEWLTDPVNIQVAPVASPAELVEQSVYFVEPRHKPHLLTHFLMKTDFTRTLVFARTKHGADKIVKQLVKNGIRAAAIHSNKSQSVRQRTLAEFKSNRMPVLVATDIAARGLDVDGISHVINYELPDVAEVYVHRIGRTGRAGATGVAMTFCGREERGQLRDIERLTRRTLTVEEDQPEYPRDEPGHHGSSNGHGPANGRGPTNGRRPAGNGRGGASGNGRGGARPGARPGRGRTSDSHQPAQNGAPAATTATAGNSAGGATKRRRRPGSGRRYAL